MLFVYPAVFHKEDDSYWAEFPDLQGCQTFGSTLYETLEFAEEALSAYVTTLLEQNRTLPNPSDIETLDLPKDCFSSLVSCKITPSSATKSVKKTLTIPEWLNDRAMQLGINFSQTLQDALLTKIQQ